MASSVRVGFKPAASVRRGRHEIRFGPFRGSRGPLVKQVAPWAIRMAVQSVAKHRMNTIQLYARLGKWLVK